MDSPVVGLRGVEGRDEQLVDRSSQLRVVSRNGDLARLCDIARCTVCLSPHPSFAVIAALCVYCRGGDSFKDARFSCF